MKTEDFISTVVNEFCRVKCEGAENRKPWLIGARWLGVDAGRYVPGPSRPQAFREQSQSGDYIIHTHEVKEGRVLVRVEAYDENGLFCYGEVDMARFNES